MSDETPAKPPWLSQVLLAFSLIVAGVGLASLVREAVVDNEATVEARKDELFRDQIYRDKTAALQARNPVAEANTAMENLDFSLLQIPTLIGSEVIGVTCKSETKVRPVPGFDDAKTALEPTTVGESQYLDAVRSFATAYNRAIARHPVFADLWGCSDDLS